MNKIRKIVSGGQSGVDRAALDFAIRNSIQYGGWCPNGGWAEDFSEPPGLLSIYNKLVETPSSGVHQRTEWNVRDSDATLIIDHGPMKTDSKGTDLTIATAIQFEKPILQVNINDPAAQEKFLSWFCSMETISVLNIAGPRESESPGIYLKTMDFLDSLVQCRMLHTE